MPSPSLPPSWLLLIHSIPPKPAYGRARIALRLRRMGAVALKNAVYVLPRDAETHENFRWLVREIEREGGSAFICEARFVGGLSDPQVVALFQAAREADYASLAAELRSALEATAGEEWLARPQAEKAALARRFRSRCAELRTIDFYGAPGREAAEALLEALEDKTRPARRTPPGF